MKAAYEGEDIADVPGKAAHKLGYASGYLAGLRDALKLMDELAWPS